MEKSLIIEAWSKYRPTSLENSPREGQTGIQGRANKKRDIQEIYGEGFLNKLIAGVRLRRAGEKIDEEEDNFV